MATVVDNLSNRENSEIRPRNVIAKYAQSVLRPFDLLAELSIVSRYKIRDGFITPNSFFYNVVSGVWSLALLFAYFFSTFRKFFTAGLEGYTFVKLYTNILIFSLYLSENVATYFTNVMQRYDNVILALRIQNICDIFKADGKSLKKYILLNWIYLSSLVFFQVIWIISYSVGFSSVVSPDETITNMFYLIFDSNLLCFGRLLRLILQPLKVWVDDARKSSGIAVSESEFYWKRKFRVYMDIVEAYEIVGKNYETLVSLHKLGKCGPDKMLNILMNNRRIV